MNQKMTYEGESQINKYILNLSMKDPSFIQQTSIILMLQDIRDTTSTFIDFFFGNQEFISKSIIHKQFKKQCNALKDISIWKNWFREYYVYVIKNTISYMDPQLLDFYNNYRQVVATNTSQAEIIYQNYQNIFENIKNTLISVYTVSLDMYYLTRMFKILKDSTNPILSIGYFGVNHTNHISYFLTNIMKLYNLTTNQIPEKAEDIFNAYANSWSRCITFPKINLNAILDKYKKMRYYTIKDIFSYTENDINNFLLTITENPIDKLNDKRYIIISYLNSKKYLNDIEFKIYGVNKIKNAIQKSNNYNEFVNDLKYTIKTIYNSDEKDINTFLSIISPHNYQSDNLIRKKYLVIKYLNLMGYLDQTEINIYGLNRVMETIKKCNNYNEFLDHLKYTIKDVYEYDEKDINHFLSAVNLNYRLYNLLEKRYLVINNLYNKGYLNLQEITKYTQSKVGDALKISNTYTEFINNLINM